jgi:DMSO/TMAO reductase YedYZ heme-binding membrane subunit
MPVPERPASSPSTWLLLACGALFADLVAAQFTLSGQQDIVKREGGTAGVIATAVVVLAATSLTLLSRKGGRWFALVLAWAGVGMLLVPTIYWWTRDKQLPVPSAAWRGPSLYWIWLMGTPLTVEGLAAVLVAGPLLVIAGVLLVVQRPRAGHEMDQPAAGEPVAAIS